MIIDIRKTVFRKRVRSFFTTIIFLIAIATFLVSDIFSYEILGINKYNFAILLAVIYIVLVSFSAIRNYNYIFYNDEGEKVILRFFSFSYFTQRKSSIELYRKDIAGFKIEKTLFGLRENLIMYQKTRNGTAKYPPVSLTALSNEEKENLINSLSNISRRFE